MGIELTDHTHRYIREVFAKAIDGLIFMKDYIIILYSHMFRYEDYTNNQYFRWYIRSKMKKIEFLNFY